MVSEQVISENTKLLVDTADHFFRMTDGLLMFCVRLADGSGNGYCWLIDPAIIGLVSGMGP